MSKELEIRSNQQLTNDQQQLRAAIAKEHESTLSTVERNTHITRVQAAKGYNKFCKATGMPAAFPNVPANLKATGNLIASTEITESNILDFVGWMAAKAKVKSKGIEKIGYKLSTIMIRVHAISSIMQLQGKSKVYTKPVKVYIDQLKKKITISAKEAADKSKLDPIREKQATAMRIKEFEQILCDLPDGTIIEKRNKALILLAFSGGFRKSELASMTWDMVEFSDRGLEIQLLATKSNPDPQPKLIGYASNPCLCPVRALRDLWERMEFVGYPMNWVFQTSKKGRGLTGRPLTVMTFHRLIKKLLGNQYSPHSLRVMLTIRLRERGVSNPDIASYVGWKSAEMVNRYAKKADGWKNEAIYNVF